jgi:hypothetical protein
MSRQSQAYQGYDANRHVYRVLPNWQHDGLNVWRPNRPGAFFQCPYEAESDPRRFRPPDSFNHPSWTNENVQNHRPTNDPRHYPASSHACPPIQHQHPALRWHHHPTTPQPSVAPAVGCWRFHPSSVPIPGPNNAASSPPPTAVLSPPSVQGSDPTNKRDSIPKNELAPTTFLQRVPDLEIVDTLEEALYAMRVTFGGKLLQNSIKTQANGNKVWTYHCAHIDEEGHKCPLSVCVKRHGTVDETKGFSNWMGKPLSNGIPRDMHHHPVKDGLDEIGLPSAIREIADILIAKDEDVRPQEVIDEIKRFLLDDLPPDHKLKSIGTDDVLWEGLKEKVRNYVKYTRKRNRGDYAIRTIQDVIDICEMHSLVIPETYVPRDDFKSAEELREALGVESVDTMLLFHLGSGSTLEKLIEFVQEEEKYSSEKVKRGIERQATSQVRVAIIACSTSLLFRLLQLSKLPEGMRVLYRDGTHGTLLCGSKLITHLISGDIRLRKTHCSVTNKCPAAFYLIAPEEYKYSTISSDIWAKDICRALFGVQLELDWAASDMAVGFLTGVKAVWKQLKGILNDCFHVLQKIGPGKGSELRKRCKTEHQKEHAPRNWALAQNSKSAAQFSCCTGLFIEDLKSGSHPEDKAAKYLGDTYLAALSRNWYYMVTGKFKSCVCITQLRKNLPSYFCCCCHYR